MNFCLVELVELVELAEWQSGRGEVFEGSRTWVARWGMAVSVCCVGARGWLLG